MTFEARELSVELGAPILLVTFSLGAKVWRFADADQDLTHAGQGFTAPRGGLALSRIQDSPEVRKNDLTLTVARDFPIAELWRVSPPTETVAVILQEIHQDETDDATAWLGHVGNLAWDAERGTAVLTLTPGSMAARSNGLRRLWQKGCPHVLYGPLCQLAKAAHQVAVTLTVNSGNALAGAGFAAGGKFAGGFIEWTDADGITDRRFITDHTPGSSAVTILGQAPTLAVGTTVQAFEGCDHTLARCDELGNVDHYGGIPYFLGKNPFDGNPVY